MKKILPIIGVALMLLSFIFIIQQVTQYDIDFSFTPSVWLGLFVVSILIGGNIILLAYNYRWLVCKLSDLTLEPRLAVKVYCDANIYKYLPGSIMYVVGRNRLALEIKELSHARVATATLLEGLFLMLAACFVSGLLVHERLLYFLHQITWIIWITLTMVSIAGLMTYVFFRKRIAALFYDVTKEVKGFNLKSAIRLMIFCVVITLMRGISFLAVVVLVGQPIAWQQSTAIIGIYILSWLAGYLTPGAPSGLGVREAVIMMVVGGMMETGIVISAIAVHRVINISGDVFAFITALVYSKIGK